MNKKIVPDPPIDTTTPDPETSRDEDLLRDRDAIKRALDYYLDPAPQYTEKPRRPSTMFMIAPNNDTESLLVNACESLASASVLTSDFAAELIGPQRHKAIAIQQVIMLAELAVNRAVDNVVPTYKHLSPLPQGLNIPYTASITTHRISLMLKSVFLSLVVFGSSVAWADTTVDVSKIYGKIQFVDSFPDYKVQVVDSFPDLKVQQVDSFPDSPGKWKTVDSFPDYKIQIVDSFPDFKIQYVDSFPGVN